MKNYRLSILASVLVIAGGVFAIREYFRMREASKLADREAALVASSQAPSQASLDESREAAETLHAAGLKLSLVGGTPWGNRSAEDNAARSITDVAFTSVESISDATIDQFRKLPQVSRISCFDLPLGDDQVGPFSRLQRPCVLDLNYTRVTDDSLRQLANCRALTGLLLNGTKITDAGLSHVATIPTLKMLTLFDTPVSDEGLDRLSGLRLLTTLDVQRTRVTLAGVARFQKSLPGCVVMFDPY